MSCLGASTSTSPPRTVAARYPPRKTLHDPLGDRVALICDIPCRVNSVQNDYVINHTQIAHVCVIDTHSAARFNPGLDDFAQLVHNVTRPVENITARIVRVILANDERFGGLIISGRAVLKRLWDDRSRYRYCFCGGLCTLRARLCKCQQRDQRAGNSNNCFLHHNASYVQSTQAPELCSVKTRSVLMCAVCTGTVRSLSSQTAPALRVVPSLTCG